MRKQLGIYASLLLLCATAFCLSGCSSNYNNGCEDPCSPPPCNPICKPVCAEPCPPTCRPVCPPAPRPVCNPVCNPVCPAPACKPVCAPVPHCEPCKACPPFCPPVCKAAAPCKYPNENQISCNGVTVRAKQPKLCILGDTYALDVEASAGQDVCDVVVNANLPDGVSVVRSEPEGISMQDHRAVWKIGGMDRGQTKTARIFLRADREGDLCVCFCVSAVPVQFCALVCAKPILICEKCGPEEVCPGDPVHYTITVTNTGSCAAEEVVVTDNVPDGLEHSSGLKTLVFKLGTLDACETKKINICMTAVKRGKVCNTVTVTACNANQTSCQWCTNVCKQCVELVKTGPKEANIGKTAEYQITVTNPGDKSLTDVVLTDIPAVATTIVEAKGAQVNNNQAIWRFKELKPGEKQSVSLVLTTCTPGYFCNRVQVSNCQGCCAIAEACTRWKGRPALNLCVTAAENPVCIGDINVYTISVVNQGSEEDTNVKVVLRFPDELQPTTGSGPTPGTVSGQTVTFAPYAHMGPRQTLQYRVEAQAKKSGDSRIKTEVTSDSVKTALTEETSTVVN